MSSDVGSCSIIRRARGADDLWPCRWVCDYARPERLQSFISAPRRCLTRCSPRTQENRVGNIAFAATVWADDASYAITGEDEVSMIRKGLKARNFESS